MPLAWPHRTLALPVWPLRQRPASSWAPRQRPARRAWPRSKREGGALVPLGAPNAGVGAGAPPNAGAAGVAAAPKLKPPGCAGFAAAPKLKAIVLSRPREQSSSIFASETPSLAARATRASFARPVLVSYRYAQRFDKRCLLSLSSSSRAQQAHSLSRTGRLTKHYADTTATPPRPPRPKQRPRPSRSTPPRSRRRA